MPSYLLRVFARTAVAAAGLALIALPVHADKDDPDDVARDIFRQVEKACPVGGEGLPYNLASIAGEYFVPDLQDMLRRAYETRSLGFDVLIDAQDCEIPDVDIDVDDGDDERGRAIARAEFENFGEKRVIDLLMVREGRGWKVADIAYRHRDWSLRRELAYAGGK